MRYLTPVPKQFVDQSGIPYSDGTVSVYLSGDSELADIYEDAEGDALYPNPCRLDSNGAWQCFVPGGVPLDYIIKDKNGNVVFEFYDVLPSGGDTAVYNIMGVEGETVVTKRSNAEGNVTATVGLDLEFKQRVTDAENDIGDLNERVAGVEGSVDELARDIGEVDVKVEDVAADVEGLHTSLNNKKDRQTPYSLNDIPPDRTVKSITQDANGRMQVETQPIQYPGHDQMDIESPEGTLYIHKTYSEGRQDFTADVADNSLDTDKVKVDQFHYIDVDHVTLESEQAGHTTVLKVKDGSMYPNLDVMQYVAVADPVGLRFEDGKCYEVENYSGIIYLATDSTDTIHCKLIISASGSGCYSVTVDFVDEVNNNMTINFSIDDVDTHSYILDIYMRRVGTGFTSHTICRVYDYPVRSRTAIDDGATYSLVGRLV